MIECFLPDKLCATKIRTGVEKSSLKLRQQRPLTPITVTVPSRYTPQQQTDPEFTNRLVVVIYYQTNLSQIGRGAISRTRTITNHWHNAKQITQVSRINFSSSLLVIIIHALPTFKNLTLRH